MIQERYAVMFPGDQGAAPRWAGNGWGDHVTFYYAKLFMKRAFAEKRAKREGGIVVTVSLSYRA